VMPLAARRTFRLASVVALSLALGYGLEMPMPFFAPFFGALLTTAPAPPMGLKAMLSLCRIVIITLGVGLMLTPLLGKYPATALLIIATGLYLGTIISIGLRQAIVGTLVAVGCAFVPGAGQVDFSIAVTVMKALLLGIAFAIASQHIVYPFFPEDPPGAAPPAPPTADPVETRWIALRSTLIVLVPVTMAFANPAMFLPVIMKSVTLSQQASVLNARTAGRAIVGATFLGGLFAILFWFGLKLWPGLWMFFLLMLLLSLYIAAKTYGVLPSRHPPAFWQDVTFNFLFMFCPAVEDTANGKDPYTAFAVRFSLFVIVSLYAWAAIAALEWLRGRRKTAATFAAQGAR
jgi:hypothetical protein